MPDDMDRKKESPAISSGANEDGLESDKEATSSSK